ncbi:PucR family transcriptional regulator [Skermania sp. ID1734]|uniref:PucR family transcriptional regulator n=1 Tax=Skermania sp. ID1734 TaxID=2597516 RepID=UPI00117D3795|nr:helix-turn-helix domain-containing protein [Skermania sp. ID1734]TSD99663.1 PucR family transcriptional regulator [Skermania sp. ID1734]
MSAVELSRLMLARIGELGDAVTDAIAREVDFYGSSGVVTLDDLRESCLANTTFVIRSLAGDTDLDVAPAEETGAARAVAGVPLTAVMSAYRVGFRVMWEETVTAARQSGMRAEAILDTTAQILQAHETFTQAMAGAYRDQLTVQMLQREEERSALVEALLFRRITDTQNLWDAADLLRLPVAGPFVVVAAQVPAIGKLGLPEIAAKLDAHDIRSAWRLLPDLQVGIVYLPRTESRTTLIRVLRSAATARVGISPDFDNLGDTGDALRLARLALAAKSSDHSLVSVFEDSPLAYAAVSSPEVMERIGRSVLGGLNALPDEERAILVETFRAWLDAGGSANETAARIYVHPNTVRHRLHRIEEHTGRSLSRPKDVAELCLAFEIDRRLP